MPDTNLEVQARAIWSSGDRSGAARLWQQVLQTNPKHAEGANALGMWHLSEGRAEQACAFLEIANAADPGQPALLFNLAAARHLGGDTTGALAALHKSLEADPYFVQAIFQIAVLLEESGQLEASSVYYQNFLDAAPPEVESDPRFAPSLARARQAIGLSQERLAAIIDVAAARLDAPPLRAMEAVGALLGKHRTFVAEPTFFSVPRLPALPFFDRDHTPWIAELEAAAPAIVEEARRVIAEDSEEASSFVPYVANPADVPSNQWVELNHSPRWGAYFFYKHGERQEDNSARCPRTAELLERMPLLRLPGRAPNALFSLLKPGTKIPPHTGVTNIRATVHLPLIVPPDCGFRVGPETREWQPGVAWAFDDTIEHEAWNNNGETRLILIFDIWNPLLSEAEQEYYAAVLAAYDQHMGRVPKDTDIF